MQQSTINDIKNSIRAIPDHPKPGILFRDITTLLQDGDVFFQTIEVLKQHYQSRGINKIVGTEARGFIFGAALAYAMQISFIPVRKPSKLPHKTISERYELEYGEDELEIHVDSINTDDQVLVIDDLLATGGTIAATTKLIRRLGGKVDDAAFVISLPDLGGEEKLKALGLEIYTLVSFPGE